MRDTEWRRSVPTGEDYVFGHYAMVVAKGQVANIIAALTAGERPGILSQRRLPFRWARTVAKLLYCWNFVLFEPARTEYR